MPAAIKPALVTQLLARGVFVLILAVILTVALFPLYYAFVSSFRTGTELFVPRLWPERFDLTNYTLIFQRKIVTGLTAGAVKG
ncbi:hypothetical protein [Chelatococcus asaccharovorans]|uniref:Carbohydrate ABC transporter permease n=1 Tax=Chelatococcus asaccharovorans TaxID=28210 RepID=A0A2V3TY38_9HYPH|nr:hypothetical protein [Chelatococcus asaccharovorans]MBS7706742.1 hypothetical protein [Chelatococcus asaccharovorans]PXW54114.1 hypothetical protein C7450_112143 [Chelatococcus asaccharovorans]